MDYNNMFPVGYQPQRMYYPQAMPQQNQAMQPQNNNLIWVQGEAGAKSYMVAPNTTVQLWDSEAQVIYLKSADASGMPSMKIIDYTIRNETPQGSLSARQSEFATKVDVESIREEIVALKGRVDSMMKRGAEIDG